MRIILVGLLTIAVFGNTFAKVDNKQPDELVLSISEEVLRILNTDDTENYKQDPTKLYGLVYDIILPVVDFNAFAKLTLGRHWRKASAEQRGRFVSEFKGMLIRTYTKYLVDYAGTEVHLLPARTPNNGGKRQIVYTEVTVPGKQPLPVNYSFWRRGGDWKVYNVTVNGLSLVQLFRTDFAREINQSSLDALIERLARTNQKTHETVGDAKE